MSYRASSFGEDSLKLLEQTLDTTRVQHQQPGPKKTPSTSAVQSFGAPPPIVRHVGFETTTTTTTTTTPAAPAAPAVPAPAVVVAPSVANNSSSAAPTASTWTPLVDSGKGKLAVIREVDEDDDDDDDDDDDEVVVKPTTVAAAELVVSPTLQEFATYKSKLEGWSATASPSPSPLTVSGGGGSAAPSAAAPSAAAAQAPVIVKPTAQKPPAGQPKQQQQQQQQQKPKNEPPPRVQLSEEEKQAQRAAKKAAKQSKAVEPAAGGKLSKAERAAQFAAAKASKEPKAATAATAAPTTATAAAAATSASGDGAAAAPTAAAAAVADDAPAPTSSKRQAPAAPVQYDVPSARKKADKARILSREPSVKHVPLFSHLPQFEQITSLSLNVGFAAPAVHPAVVQLGLRLASGDVSGSNRCAITLLHALQQLVRDYTPPARGTLAHDFETHLKPHLQFLIDCRPLTISMANAIKYFKVQISETLGKELNDARASLVETTDAYIHERIVLADKLISQHAAKKIADGDVVMTYSLSDATEQTFVQAQANGTKFRVVVVDAPYGHALELVRRIVRLGIECDYVLLSGASYKMTEVTKVVLGADAMMSNGALLASAGTASIALLAKAFHLPVLVLCETYKFCERVQLDSITSNELLDPEALLQRTEPSSPLRGWRDNAHLKLLALRYDITPIDLIDVVVTEVGLVPPTSVPVIVREFRREVQM